MLSPSELYPPSDGIGAGIPGYFGVERKAPNRNASNEVDSIEGVFDIGDDRPSAALTFDDDTKVGNGISGQDRTVAIGRCDRGGGLCLVIDITVHSRNEIVGHSSEQERSSIPVSDVPRY